MNRNEMVYEENKSIFDFLNKNKKYIKGRVIDFGAGHMPYKKLIESLPSVNMYVPYDSTDYPATRVIPGEYYESNFNKHRGTFNTVICTQVFQYTLDPIRLAGDIYSLLTADGICLVTYPTCWDEIEPEDYLRYTLCGMEKIFGVVGFNKIKNISRFSIPIGDDLGFSLGGGYVGRVK